AYAADRDSHQPPGRAARHKALSTRGGRGHHGLIGLRRNDGRSSGWIEGCHPGGDLGPGRITELVADLGDVPFSSTLGDEEGARDLLVGEPLSHQAGDLELPLAEALLRTEFAHSIWPD